MIDERIVEIEQAETKGFEVTASELTVEVSEGTIIYHKEQQSYSFPSFSFDCEADHGENADIDVIYDVYLILQDGEPNIELYRTESAGGNEAFFEPKEGKELLHNLMSITIPPRSNTLDLATGYVTKIRRVVR